MKKVNSLLFLISIILITTSCSQDPTIEKQNLNLTWKKTSNGYELLRLEQKTKLGEWSSYGTPSGRYTYLYSAEEPLSQNDTTITNNTGDEFPEPVFKFMTKHWASSINPVTLNKAGIAVNFYPEKYQNSNDTLIFYKSTEAAEVKAIWTSSKGNSHDIMVSFTLTAKKNGWFSIATPTLAMLDTAELGWGVVPGYFQGDRINKDLVSAIGYAQGLPSIPFVAQDRTVTTPASILQNKDSLTLSVILDPGQTRKLFTEGENTHKISKTGFSHMNRMGQLSPTVYYPLLNHPDAYLNIGERMTVKFRYRLSNEDWYSGLQFAMDSVYEMTKSLALRKQEQSLTKRVNRLLAYSLDDETSFWQEMTFEGESLGAQRYMGGVVGADRDATKNSDIGAMWMMAALTDNEELIKRRLPLVRNFKLLQQESDSGFFHGAARGQYFLFKSKKWVEEWGSHIEPIGVTYYTLADLGNILLFQPEDEELKAAFRAGAERLLEWQQQDGSWVVGYDHQSYAPVYSDLKDLRPTFYGMLIAYEILGEEKYLRAAIDGADWMITQGVKKGHFIGVCGDARFTNDFATVQTAQALYDLWEVTGDDKYLEASIATTKMYVTSIYSHPKADKITDTIRGKHLEGWQYTHAGLGFEHGGTNGSAVTFGPIVLASHAGMFVRMAQQTGNPYFATLARAAVWGRDVHVNDKTSVASYYWRSMDKGAGSFPHHAWWQMGLLMDYLISEADYRSKGQVQFPSGFMTAKVGPHKPYGFKSGVVCGDSVQLFFKPELVEGLPPTTDVLMAKGIDTKHRYLILLQNSTDDAQFTWQFNTKLIFDNDVAVYSTWNENEKAFSKAEKFENQIDIKINGAGIEIIKLQP